MPSLFASKQISGPWFIIVIKKVDLLDPSIHPHRTGIPWVHNPMWSRLRERSPLLFYSYSEQMNVTHITQTVKTDFMHEDGNEANVAMKRGRAVLTCCTRVAINMDKFHHPFLLPLLAPKEYRVTLKSLIINRNFFLKNG